MPKEKVATHSCEVGREVNVHAQYLCLLKMCYDVGVVAQANRSFRILRNSVTSQRRRYLAEPGILGDSGGT